MESKGEDAVGAGSNVDEGKKQAPVSPQGSDPPEDDLDDLDDILDDFGPLKLDSPNVFQAETSTLGSTETAQDSSGPAFEEFQIQMAALIGDMSQSPGVDVTLASFTEGNQSETGRGPSGPSIGTNVRGDAFQDSIQRTVERIQSTTSQPGSTSPEHESDDLLAQLLKELQNEDSAGEADDGLNKMLLGMMEQLTNKDILYDPMKELHDKFPGWMEEHRDTEARSDMERYQSQQLVVGEIVHRFEQKGYSDSATADREFIIDRMQKMQAAGNLPADLIGGIEANDTLGDMDSLCAQQ